MRRLEEEEEIHKVEFANMNFILFCHFFLNRAKIIDNNYQEYLLYICTATLIIKGLHLNLK